MKISHNMHPIEYQALAARVRARRIKTGVGVVLMAVAIILSALQAHI